MLVAWLVGLMELFEKMRRLKGRDRRVFLDGKPGTVPFEALKIPKTPNQVIQSTPGYSIGQLIAPRNDNGGHPGEMQFERIPGIYHCSKEGTRVIFGLKILNPPRALAELIEEVNHASPKQVFFFDSGPDVIEDNPHAANWTDYRSHPTIIPIFLNPKRAVPELVAHELMHSWVDFYAGLEYRRTYFDQRNRVVSNTVDFLQSMVIDCTILWLLRKRGAFDLDLFRRDIVAAARENITPLMSGMMHATPFGQLMAAQTLAVPKACADLYQLTKEDRDEVEQLWRFCRKAEPCIARTADKLAAALREHGYETELGIKASIEKSLTAAFEFLCIPFDLEKDMVPSIGKITWADKMPDYMPGLPVKVKHEALCQSVWSRRPILWSAYTPEEKEILVHYAGEGLPYSSLLLPRITTPKEFESPKHIFYFEPGTSEKEMEEWTPPESTLPLPPIDIYAPSYVLTSESARESNRLSSEGDCHVLCS